MSKKCDHRGLVPIRVGPYEVYAGGMLYSMEYENFDVLVPLDRQFRYDGERTVLPAIIPDYHPPGPEIAGFLRDQLIPELEAGKRVVVFCLGSHGRTGTVIAGLIALLEPETDPITAVRERHCGKAVETREQAQWVRDLHVRELSRRVTEVVAEVDSC
jgi:protein-tyrosine phosphatase